MPLDQLLGQPTAQGTLVRALESGRVHHAYRFEGPAGVGKTTAALGFAQALLCPHAVLGCGECSSCRRAVTLSDEAPHVPSHPDLLFVGRGMYPENLIGKSEATGISVEQIRRIVLGRLGFAPHEGRALVVVIHDAEELTISAANALLKTLEEPADKTHFILLTSRPGQLLDTIRSRTLSVRFGPLPTAVLGDLLEARGQPRELAEHARGSLEVAESLTDSGLRDSLDAFVRLAEAAVDAPRANAALEFAAERPEKRDDLRMHLRHLGMTWAIRARQSDPERARVLSERYLEVERAIDEVEKNGAQALVLESLILRLRKLPGLLG
jgi:DNA polymerase-3 subunit delta'